MRNLLYFVIFLSCNIKCNDVFDLTLVGYIMPADGLGGIPLWFLDCLEESKLNINWINTRDHIPPNSDSFSEFHKKVLFNDKVPGKISILTDLLWYGETDYYKKVPNSSIKFAYSMLECSHIPIEWVNILNDNFDAVIVPDSFLIEVYKNSGVKIPIFVLPGILHNLETNIPRQSHKSTFTFGNTCAIVPRKNHIKLIEAFHKAFGNNPRIKLKINARDAEPDILKILKNKITNLKSNNITINVQSLSKEEYVNFLESLDCYVTISQGEGFSIPPREALLLGKPVILSDNSAHHDMCNTGFVESVTSIIPVPATYYGFNYHQRIIGTLFDCEIDDVVKALENVYYNYDHHFTLAQNGKLWVKQFTKKNLAKKYLTLIKPKKIILGLKNTIEDDSITTNSIELYNKYLISAVTQ